MIKRAQQRFGLVRPVLVPLILYIGTAAVVGRWMSEIAPSPWRYVVALAPMGPGVFVAWGIVRAIRRLDELDQKIILEGLAVSFVVTLMLAASLGFLGLAGLPQLSGIYIALFMATTWLIGKLLVARQYR